MSLDYTCKTYKLDEAPHQIKLMRESGWKVSSEDLYDNKMVVLFTRHKDK